MSANSATVERRIKENEQKIKSGKASGEGFYYDKDGHPHGIDFDSGVKADKKDFAVLIESLGLTDKFKEIEDNSEKTVAAALAAMTPEERAKELIKASMTFGTSLDDLMKRK